MRFANGGCSDLDSLHRSLIRLQMVRMHVKAARSLPLGQQKGCTCALQRERQEKVSHHFDSMTSTTDGWRCSCASMGDDATESGCSAGCLAAWAQYLIPFLPSSADPNLEN